jgi:hypothetical protein
MKPKKKEFREPKSFVIRTPRDSFALGALVWIAEGRRYIDARVIREKDFQRLLKAARRKRG